MGSIYIGDFPDEILLHIFSYLSREELAAGPSHVNRRWQAVCNDDTLWRDSDYVVGENQTDEEALSLVMSMPQLRVLRLQRMLPSGMLQHVFRTCHSLTKLEIHWRHKLLPSELSCLVENCPNIERLVVPGQRTTVEHLELISKMENLKSLRFEYRTLTYQPFRLQQLADGCPKLRCLEIPLQFCAGDELDNFLAVKAGQIEALELRWMTSDRRCVLPMVATLCGASLKRLTLGWYDVPIDRIASALFSLRDLVNLQELAAPYAYGLPPGILAQVFSGAAVCRLKKLDLRSSGLAVDDDALLAICRSCSELCELLLGGCRQISDAGLQLLGNGLETLDLSNCCSLGGGAITAIARCCPGLRNLQLQCQDMSRLRPGLRHLLGLKKLETLDLTSSIVSVLPLGLFPKHLHNLRMLKLSFCEGIGVGGLRVLRTLMPQLKIVIGDLVGPEDR
ncbi:F-box/LRR-repeat protein 20-like [Schistocerca cancellata]|uniref:F-box/LRR-repeat protein 20-like n=1 Tax=Schistocerca cancellata TaxID=274614 RepID=UPI002119AF5E|nr:F-box/LRR-repeat protein 20-like [Schistocerca cancellata]